MAVITNFPDLGGSMLEASLRSRQLDQQANDSYLEAYGRTSQLQQGLLAQMTNDSLGWAQLAQRGKEFDATHTEGVRQYNTSMKFQEDVQQQHKTQWEKEFKLAEEQFGLTKKESESNEKYRNRMLQNSEIAERFARVQAAQTQQLNLFATLDQIKSANKQEIDNLIADGLAWGSDPINAANDHYNLMVDTIAQQLVGTYDTIGSLGEGNARIENGMNLRNVILQNYQTSLSPEAGLNRVQAFRDASVSQVLDGQDQSLYGIYKQANPDNPNVGTLNEIVTNESDKNDSFGLANRMFNSLSYGFQKLNRQLYGVDMTMENSLMNTLEQGIPDRETIAYNPEVFEKSYDYILNTMLEVGTTTAASRTGSFFLGNREEHIRDSRERAAGDIHQIMDDGVAYFSDRIARDEYKKPFSEIEDPVLRADIHKKAVDKAIPSEVRQGIKAVDTLEAMKTLQAQLGSGRITKQNYQIKLADIFGSLGVSGNLASRKDKLVKMVQQGKIKFISPSSEDNFVAMLESMVDFGSLNQPSQ